ncbi:MAG: insulinase family protein [Cytophagales bacterium]|nr:MAG: insulinase family protein [Cytophagales bacterium]
MLNRTTPPSFQIIDTIDILPMQTKKLKNGVLIHSLSVGEQEIIKFEIVFLAGTNYETHKGVAAATAKMLLAGTEKYNAHQIDEYFDELGAYYDISTDLKHITLSIFVLRKYFKNILSFLNEILQNCNFPIEEWQINQKKTIQSLLVNLEKTNFIARQHFREKLFGIEHIFGKTTQVEDIEKIKNEDLIQYFKDNIDKKPFEIFLTGKFDNNEIEIVENIFGERKIEPQSKVSGWKTPIIQEKKEFYLDIPNKVQTSFCIGQILFNQKHEDYIPLRILTTIFGGYFGSRLMKNIREDKGYTYGISAALVPVMDAGYYVILADVKKEFYQNVLTEIHKEAKILQTELVSLTELATVRNYLLGKFADGINTSFELADLFKNVYFADLDYNYYHQYIKKIQTITPEELLLLAQKYLKTDTMTCIGIG